MPDLTLLGLDGGILETRNLRGRVLALNMWATWCPPCRREMPSLQRLADGVDGDRIMVAGLSVDRDLNLVREFVLSHGIRFPQYVDPEMAVANGVLRVVGFPETFVVAPDGRLAARVVGERSWDAPEMREALEALARGEPARIR
jgi:thiol-disulfide isomerase/thioredoxin